MSRTRGMLLLALFLVGAALVGPAAAQEPEHAQEPDQAVTAEHAAEDEHAAEGDHAEEGHHFAYPTTAEYIFKWINFAMLLVVLYFLLVTPPAFVKENFEFEGLKPILAERSAAIVAARELAREQHEQAERGLADSAARLEKVEEEAAALVAEAQTAAASDKARIIEDATAQAETIRSGASRDMDAEVNRARRDLQAHVAHLAVGIATKLVQDNFRTDDQDRLVRDYLDRLGESVS